MHIACDHVMHNTMFVIDGFTKNTTYYCMYVML